MAAAAAAATAAATAAAAAAQSRPAPAPLQALTSQHPATASDDGVRLCCKFKLRHLSEATGGFSNANVIGEGGFGKVYRGTLVDGTEVAVKRLDPLSLQGDREFYAEVALLTRLRHPNLVCIMGMCDEDGTKLGVFEYMRRGSLRDLLDKKLLSSWKDRLAVAIGSARGLTYLHEMSEPPVIHCDFKSSNVLIDQYGQAHVADFGLARHIGGARAAVSGPGPYAHMSDVTTVTSIRGTYGYLSPEYLEQGQASVRADVFAYGVVLLEIMTGQQAVDATRGRGAEGLADWARPMLRQPEVMQAMLDPCIADQARALQVAVLCEVAEACLRANPRERPSMLDIVRTLTAAVAADAEPAAATAPAPPPPPPPQQQQQQQRRSALESARTSASCAAPAPAAPVAATPTTAPAPAPARPPVAPLQPPRLHLTPIAGGWGPGSPISAPTHGQGVPSDLSSPLGSGGWGAGSHHRRLMPIESMRADGDADAPLPVPAIRPVRAGPTAVMDEAARAPSASGGTAVGSVGREGAGPRPSVTVSQVGQLGQRSGDSFATLPGAASRVLYAGLSDAAATVAAVPPARPSQQQSAVDAELPRLSMFGFNGQ